MAVFQVKDFVSIVASMVNHMRASTRRFTDYNVGSVVRTMLEAPAVEIDELYQQMLRGLVEAIPVATYRSFAFDLLPPRAASGVFRVLVTVSASPIVISAGATFTRADGAATYTSIADATIAPGSMAVDVPVAASLPGAAGNTPANSAFILSPTPTGFVSASNLVALGNGSDQETEDQRFLRFQDFIRTLSRGTIAAIGYAARTASLSSSTGVIVEKVASARVVESYVSDGGSVIGPGPVSCYIHNGTGGTTQALVDRAQQIIDGYTDVNGTLVPGYKAAGIPCTVYAAPEQAVNLAGTVSVAPAYDAPTVLGLVQTAVLAYIAALPTGAPALVAQMEARAVAIPGCTNLVLTSPAADVVPPATTKLKVGTVALVTG